MLNVNEIGAYIDQHYTETLFRLETLPVYLVDDDGEDYRRYVAGLPGPTMSRKSAWLEVLRSEHERGLYQHRVHVWSPPLTDYLRYEAEWGYAYNVEAGEDIRILDTSEQGKPDAVLNEDFWLIDNTHVVRMHYDSDGRLLGGSIAPSTDLPRYQAARDAAWSAAVPFRSWWNQHPEYRRDTPAA